MGWSNSIRSVGAAFCAISWSFVFASPVEAQLLSNTYVKLTGSDLADCSLSTPCSTLEAAYAKTAEHGVITALEPGEFGPTPQINKSISIVGGGPGFTMGPVTIYADPTDVVHLAGFSIETTNRFIGGGLQIWRAGSVYIEDCVIGHSRPISSFRGLVVDTQESVRVFVSNCTIIQTMYAISVGASSGVAAVILDNVRVLRSYSGIRAGTGGVVFLNNSSVVLNTTNLSTDNGGRIYSFGNSSIAGGVSEPPLPLRQQ